ncbi:MAG TPA: hypothetical protein VGL62_06010, partial [Vicinamibacterales bacterium]
MSTPRMQAALLVDALRRDICYAARRIRREPGTSSVIIVTLMLTVAANTTLFSLVNAIVRRPLPVAEPDRLVVVSVLNPRNGQQLFTYEPTFEKIRERQVVFESLSLYAGGGGLRADVRGVGVDGVIETATSGYFESLGVHPYLGRFPTVAENPPSGHAAPY